MILLSLPDTSLELSDALMLILPIRLPFVGETRSQLSDDTEALFEFTQQQQATVTGVHRPGILHDYISFIESLQSQLTTCKLCINKVLTPFVKYFYGQ
jgi:hypothetical protein